MSSGMQVAASRNTALCSIPSGPKMKFVNALWVTTGWPAWPVCVSSTIAVAYLGEAFLSPAKMKSRSRPVGRVDQALPAAHEIVGQFARVLEKCVSFDVDDLEVGSLNAADKRE